MWYFTDLADDKYGNGQSGVSVTVKLNGATATIYSDSSGSVASNPLTTDSNGVFSFWYAVPGIYTFEVGGVEVGKKTLNAEFNVANFGAVTGTSSSQTSAWQSAIDVRSTLGGGDIIVPAGTWRLDTQVTVKNAVRLLLDQEAVIVHGANANLFRMKPRSRFEGGKVDTSSTSIASFASTVFEFDGTDANPNFRGVEPTVVRTEVVGRYGTGTGTAFHLHATGASSHVYGVQIDSAVDGFEFGAKLENDDSGAGTRWVNGNNIRLRGVATVNLIKQITGTDGSGVDGNVFEIDYQTDVTNTSTVIQIVGRYNTVRGMVWDYAQVPKAITFSAGSARNAMSIHGVQSIQITDSGAGNVIFTYTDGSPALKVSALAQNAASTLPITSMDVVMSNNKNLQWKDSGGTTRSIVSLTSGDNMAFGTSALNNAQFTAATKHQMLIGAVEKLRLDGSSTAGDTALLLWDVSKATLSRVTVGANDSGGTGFKVLRVPN